MVKKADATVKRRPEKPWRRRRNSNPRQGYKPRYGLANRPRRPLEYSSAIAALIVYHEPVFLSNHLGPATAPGDPGRARCGHHGGQPGRAPGAPSPRNAEGWPGPSAAGRQVTRARIGNSMVAPAAASGPAACTEPAPSRRKESVNAWSACCKG